jgi:hypothetical protein
MLQQRAFFLCALAALQQKLSWKYVHYTPFFGKCVFFSHYSEREKESAGGRQEQAWGREGKPSIVMFT